MFSDRELALGAKRPSPYAKVSDTSPYGMQNGSTVSQNGMMNDPHMYVDPDGDCEVIVQMRPGILGHRQISGSDIFHPSKFQEGDFLFVWKRSAETKREESIYFTIGQMNHFLALMTAIGLEELDKLPKIAGSPYRTLTEDEIYRVAKHHADNTAHQYPALAFLSKQFIAEQFSFFGISFNGGRMRSGLDEGCGAVVAGFTHAKASFYGSGLLGNYIWMLLMPRGPKLGISRAHAFHLMSYFSPRGPPVVTQQYTERCGKPSFATLIKIGTLAETTENSKAMPVDLIEKAQALPTTVDPRAILDANSALVTFGLSLPHKMLAPPIQV